MRRAWLSVCAVLLAACGPGDAQTDGQREGLVDQGPYHRADEPGPALFDPVPPGTVPRGALEREAAVTAPPAPPDPRRGRERYTVYCAPCHGGAGYGDGIVVRHGFPAPPSFHDPERRALDLAGIVAVVTHGQGAMYPFADRIDPADRWSIAAYVKALQLSQEGEAAP